MSSSSTSETNSTWTKDSWRSFEAEQQPSFEDEVQLGEVIHELEQKPPLVTPWEIDRLAQQLAAASEGKRFLLQGGDCA